MAVVGVLAALWVLGVFGVLGIGIGQWFQDFGPENDEWVIGLDDEAVGIHTVTMVTTFTPPDIEDFADAAVRSVSGRLVWDETVITLCTIEVLHVDSQPSVQVGATFSTDERCDGSTGMQEAFDDFGLPSEACVSVRWSTGEDDEHCEPLAVD